MWTGDMEKKELSLSDGFGNGDTVLQCMGARGGRIRKER
jgi:hypothetical protein